MATMKTIYNLTALNAIINASSVQSLKIRAQLVGEIEKILLFVHVSQDFTMI
jgi:hypothetical protein